jgi:hypothetical protein
MSDSLAAEQRAFDHNRLPMDFKTAALQQLDAVLGAYRQGSSRAQHDDMSDLGRGETGRILALSRAAVERIAGKTSTYARHVEEILLAHGTDNAYNIPQIIGIVEALRADVAAGALQTIAELIHGEVFGDFLEMANTLLDTGYKDAAAVIAGSALEAHLRQLCAAHAVETQVMVNGDIVTKKADRLNADLASSGAVSKLDQKNVTAWLDLRNRAAHGHYDQYDKSQVGLLVAGIRDFVTRNPA